MHKMEALGAKLMQRSSSDINAVKKRVMGDEDEEGSEDEEKEDQNAHQPHSAMNKSMNFDHEVITKMQSID